MSDSFRAIRRAMILVLGSVPDRLLKYDFNLKVIGIYKASSLNEATAKISVDLV
jgi:hypothetical protein